MGDTKEDLETRINLLNDEIRANEEENYFMRQEIDELYERIDAIEGASK